MDQAVAVHVETFIRNAANALILAASDSLRYSIFRQWRLVCLQK